MKTKNTRDADREFDKSYLRARQHGYVVHRDYAAHFFRWGWVSRKFIDPTKNVLDIGCGPDAALVKVLSHKLANGIPKSYLGVDLNTLKDMPKRPWAEFKGDFNFPKQWKELKSRGQFDVITCLEVVEHMRPAAVRQLLIGAFQLLAPGGKMLLSTPVFDGHMAQNHINEMTIETLQKELYRTGWTVLKRYGTFMNDGARKKVATKEENALCERLKEYYSMDVLACFLAPLYPDHSRNNLWVCVDDFI